MNNFQERRDSTRIDLNNIDGFFRQCDIATSSCNSDLDITILNISPCGMKLKLNSKEDLTKLDLNAEVFIRGCIFNDRIGFLSSQKAVAVWKEESLVGLRFTPELDFDEPALRKMMKNN
ncbi:hypothetical protein SAMN05660337_1802 [Maridesulfovibrio ferrireducens]|uniref:PilZ domain-containing protein n=1 Tax=Maridesulfovibrio ferrireducens TaxID=246191 RepID=A0A1G9G281_9BACT|nr:pilus assembly protein PilZ [Maridesulfovibrio ferrireducens]SDK94717.1 hypothetical protein SAMN05660337_1802 [Maridesulfovibrio ferrireducens]